MTALGYTATNNVMLEVGDNNISEIKLLLI